MQAAEMSHGPPRALIELLLSRGAAARREACPTDHVSALSGSWFAVLRLGDLELQMLASGMDIEQISGLDLVAQKLFRERVFQEFFDRAPHRSCSVDWVVSLVD